MPSVVELPYDTPLSLVPLEAARIAKCKFWLWELHVCHGSKSCGRLSCPCAEGGAVTDGRGGFLDLGLRECLIFGCTTRDWSSRKGMANGRCS